MADCHDHSYSGFFDITPFHRLCSAGRELSLVRIAKQAPETMHTASYYGRKLLAAMIIEIVAIQVHWLESVSRGSAGLSWHAFRGYDHNFATGFKNVFTQIVEYVVNAWINQLAADNFST